MLLNKIVVYNGFTSVASMAKWLSFCTHSTSSYRRQGFLENILKFE